MLFDKVHSPSRNVRDVKPPSNYKLYSNGKSWGSQVEARHTLVDLHLYCGSIISSIRSQSIACFIIRKFSSAMVCLERLFDFPSLRKKGLGDIDSEVMFDGGKGMATTNHESGEHIQRIAHPQLHVTLARSKSRTSTDLKLIPSISNTSSENLWSCTH